MTPRIDDTSAVAKSGCSVIATSIVGTAITVVTRYVSISSSARPGSNASSYTSVAPFATAPSTVTTHPAVWNSGHTPMRTPSSPSPDRSIVWAPLLTNPRWCNNAPFGKPVVPDVYWIIAGSDGAGSGSAPENW